ncbi:MAG: alpha/beta hydrolase [Asgard group archaeon]|nr:alpha/beta hydrolase [Asgard group archaeon]
MPKISHNGVAINYEIFGTGDPLLLIHGLGSNAQDWEPQISSFSKNYRVIAVDLRGHGESDKPKGPYNIRQFADDCKQLLTELNINRVHILGLSLGCAVGYELAIHYPELIHSFIGVNMGPSVGSKSLKGTLAGIKRLMIVVFLGMRYMAKTIAKAVFPNPNQADLRQLLTESIAKNKKRPYISSLLALKGWSIVDELPSIQCPTLIVASELDYSSIESKQVAVDAIPNAELQVVKGARHVLPVEKPDSFNKIVHDFLNKHPI